MILTGAGARPGSPSAARSVAPGLIPATQMIENLASAGFAAAATTAVSEFAYNLPRTKTDSGPKLTGKACDNRSINSLHSGRPINITW